MASGFMESGAVRERDAEARAASFRRRVTAQQIMRNYCPLLVVSLREGHGVERAASSDSFRRDLLLSRSLAARVYGAVHGKDPDAVTAVESRSYRDEVVALLARLRERDVPVDPDAIVATLTESLAQGHPDFEGEATRWKDVSARGSSAMTASRATLALWAAVDAYDFRLGRDRALSSCTDAVAAAASEAVAALLDATSTVEDRRSLTQSYVRDLSGLLAARYESTARRTVDAVLGMPVERHARFFSGERPFDAMLDAFRTDARSFVSHVARATEAQVDAEARRETERGYG